MSDNAILPVATGLAETIAQQTLAKRQAQYVEEIHRLIDAGRAVMQTCGTTSSPRVADIVTAAGLSNDAFYRHFASKEALVAAIIDDGATRLASYLEYQMAKVSTPDDQVRCWVEGVMAQAADEDIATTTLAVMWNGGRIGDPFGTNRLSHPAALATLLREPFAQLGSSDPERDAALAAHATVGTLSDFLWQRVRPTRAEIDYVVDFCLAAARTARAVRLAIEP